MIVRGPGFGARLSNWFAIIAGRRERRPSSSPAAIEWYDQFNVSWSTRMRHRFWRLLSRSSQVHDRGITLLLRNLSPSQRTDFIHHGHFHVVGGKTKRLYRISQGRQMNVRQLDDRNRCVYLWCFYPAGGLVDGDVMLAQKLALELFEDEALAVANRVLNHFAPI